MVLVNACTAKFSVCAKHLMCLMDDPLMAADIFAALSDVTMTCRWRESGTTGTFISTSSSSSYVSTSVSSANKKCQKRNVI